MQKKHSLEKKKIKSQKKQKVTIICFSLLPLTKLLILLKTSNGPTPWRHMGEWR